METELLREKIARLEVGAAGTLPCIAIGRHRPPRNAVPVRWDPATPLCWLHQAGIAEKPLHRRGLSQHPGATALRRHAQLTQAGATPDAGERVAGAAPGRQAAGRGARRQHHHEAVDSRKTCCGCILSDLEKLRLALLEFADCDNTRWLGRSWQPNTRPGQGRPAADQRLGRMNDAAACFITVVQYSGRRIHGSPGRRLTQQCAVLSWRLRH